MAITKFAAPKLKGFKTPDKQRLKHVWLPNFLTVSIVTLSALGLWQAQQKLHNSFAKVPVVEAADLAGELKATLQVPVKQNSTDLSETVEGIKGPLTLPKIASDGTTPLKAYRREALPLTKGFAQVSIVIEDMGLSDPILDIALKGLPADIALAFNPYAPNIEKSMAVSRTHAFEVLLSLPMEPEEYPQKDAGNQSLKLDYSANKNIEHMHWAMDQATNECNVGQYIGMLSMFGSAFTTGDTETPALKTVYKELAKRGLLFINNTPYTTASIKTAASTGLPVINSTPVGTALSKNGLQEQFATIEKIAKTNGHIVIVVKPYPIVLKMLQEWLAGLESKQLQLIPVSQQIRF